MDKQDNIEKYLLNLMTESEKADFENELKNNSLLKEQLELEQDIVQQIRKRAFVDKQIIAAKKEMQRGRTIRLMIYSVVSIAAMLVLVFVVQGVWQGRQYDQLYSTNFSTYTNDYLATDGTYRGDAEIDSMQVSAMTAYEKKDFATAEIQFARILSSNDNPDIRFYLAIAQLETSQIKEAQTNLQTLYLQPGEYRYYEQIRWYLALLHLKLHHKTEVKKYLNELIILEGKYWDKAKELHKKCE